MDTSKITDIRAYGRYFRKLCSIPAQQAIDAKDAFRLKGYLHPGVFGGMLHDARAQLGPFYDDYITRVSRYDYAISLELAAFLMALCRFLRPDRVLDLGSGFSSFVFRLYKKDIRQEAVVWSVDDSPEWLTKTREFLTRQGLSLDNLDTWESFARQKELKFDLVLHDLDGIPTRERVFPDVLSLAAAKAAIVVDDMHMFDHAVHMKRMLAQAKLKYYSTSFFTKDKDGRYAYLVRF